MKTNLIPLARIGNDIPVTCPVNTNGESIALEGRDITVAVIDPLGRKLPIEWTASAADVCFTIPGAMQLANGIYTLRVTEQVTAALPAGYDSSSASSSSSSDEGPAEQPSVTRMATADARIVRIVPHSWTAPPPSPLNHQPSTSPQPLTEGIEDLSSSPITMPAINLRFPPIP